MPRFSLLSRAALKFAPASLALVLFAVQATPAAACGSLLAPAATAGAQVLQQVRVQALDITVVKGSGDEIVQWGRDNGFFIDKETEGHLLGYAKGSPFFM